MSSHIYNDRDMTFMIVLGMVLGAILGVLFTVEGCEAGHVFLGAKGGPCCANHTCRENLICQYGEGHEPGTCVSKVGK